MAANGRKNADSALLLGLASGKTIADAAQSAGVSERTAFRRQVAELRAEMVSRALGKMADSMTEAADCLRALLHAESESTRLGAARSILELASKLRDSVELDERLAALELRFQPKDQQ
jgi:hypothetical protein